MAKIKKKKKKKIKKLTIKKQITDIIRPRFKPVGRFSTYRICKSKRILILKKGT